MSNIQNFDTEHLHPSHHQLTWFHAPPSLSSKPISRVVHYTPLFSSQTIPLVCPCTFSLLFRRHLPAITYLGSFQPCLIPPRKGHLPSRKGQRHALRPATKLGLRRSLQSPRSLPSPPSLPIMQRSRSRRSPAFAFLPKQERKKSSSSWLIVSASSTTKRTKITRLMLYA